MCLINVAARLGTVTRAATGVALVAVAAGVLAGCALVQADYDRIEDQLILPVQFIATPGYDRTGAGLEGWSDSSIQIGADGTAELTNFPQGTVSAEESGRVCLELSESDPRYSGAATWQGDDKGHLRFTFGSQSSTLSAHAIPMAELDWTRVGVPFCDTKSILWFGTNYDARRSQ